VFICFVCLTDDKQQISVRHKNFIMFKISQFTFKQTAELSVAARWGVAVCFTSQRADGSRWGSGG
jgi:hypothetical protein